MRKKLTTLLALMTLATATQAQTADELFATVRTKVLLPQLFPVRTVMV